MTGGLGSFGFGTGPDLDTAFQVVAATSLSNVLVRVDFSATLDPTHTANFNPVNYTIDGLEIFNVDPGGSGSVIIQTSPQTSGFLYQVVVNSTPGRIQALEGDYLDPDFAVAPFRGPAINATFTAMAQSSRKIRLEFSEPLPTGETFPVPAHFVLHRVDGLVATIEAVEFVGPDATRVQLILGQDLTPMGYYSVQVRALLQTAAGHVIAPDQALFQWKRNVARPIRIEFDRFSGEVTGGLLGNPAGQVFFSPAFGASAANSVIQVDRVNVCTRAYDVYQRPPEPAVRVPSFLGPATPLPLQLYVVPSTPVLEELQDGSVEMPFATLQAAVDATLAGPTPTLVVSLSNGHAGDVTTGGSLRIRGFGALIASLRHITVTGDLQVATSRIDEPRVMVGGDCTIWGTMIAHDPDGHDGDPEVVVGGDLYIDRASYDYALAHYVSFDVTGTIHFITALPSAASGPLDPPLVLWGPAHRFGQATLYISDTQVDTVPTAVDGPAEGLLTEPIDITRAAFLNDDRWRIFPGIGASLGSFRTADNLTPIGPGPTVGPFSIP